MSVINAVENDLSVLNTWIKSLAAKLASLFLKISTDSPQVANDLNAVLMATEDFLAAATPAVAEDGLDCPPDSVAYANFVKLATAWQKLGSSVLEDIKELK